MTSHAEWTASDMLALARAHAEAEVVGDLDAVMATMSDHPEYAFYPCGVTFSGTDAVRRYYTHACAVLPETVTASTMLREWADDHSVAQEYEITAQVDGRERTFHVVGIINGQDRRVSGERIYTDDAFARILLGDLFDEFGP